MREFRFAIMGAGSIAQHFCSAVKPLENCRVVAIASKSAERAAQFATENDVAEFFDSYEEMLKRVRPDCVYIAVTPNDHYRLGMLCLDYDIPVLCEKAMFLNSQEARTFFAAAEAKGLFSMEALWSRFLPSLNTARGWLRDRRIGELVLAEISVGFAAPTEPTNRFFSTALGGGAASDVTVYGYELITWLLERKVQRSHVEVVAAATGVDATELITLRLEGDVLAVIKASIMTCMEVRIVIYGTQGKVVIPNTHYSNEAYLYGAKSEMLEHFSDTLTQHGFTYEILETMRCIRQKRLESEIVSHADTIACAEMFDQINLAMKES